VALVGATVVATSSFVVSGGTAHAAPSVDTKGGVRVARFDAKALGSAVRTSAALASSDVKTRQHVKEHLDDSARNGRLIDERAIHVTTVDDPFAAGEKIQLAWDGDKSPENLTYAQRGGAQSGSADSVALGVQLGGGAEATPAVRRQPQGAGAGYAAGFNVQNMVKSHNDCAATWFKPTYRSDRDHKIVSCFEDWEQNGTEHFVYNRWALWTPAPPSISQPVRTVDFYVASRPWKGHEGDFARINDGAPREPREDCDKVQDFKLGGGYHGVTGEVTIPINTCRNYWLDVNPNTKKIGIDFDGERNGQMYMDVAGDYTAVNATVQLVWADYNWVELSVCRGQTGCSTSGEQWAAKDSGW
jgi:hypothetical protein